MNSFTKKINIKIGNTGPLEHLAVMLLILVIKSAAIFWNNTN